MSAAAHVLLVALYPLLTGVPGVVGPTERPPDERRPIEGIEVVELRELLELPDEVVVPDPVPEPPEESEPDAPLESEPGPPAVDVAEEVEEPEEGLSIAERLQPQMIDPRLWAPVDSQHIELTEAERAELLFRGMLRSWNDSMAVAAALREDARDWTYTDSDGRRWGLAPGRLHLGDFSIPLPFSFAPAPGQWETAMERQWLLDDLARGRDAAIIRETWAERAREIRERMESQRPSASEADDGSGG